MDIDRRKLFAVSMVVAVVVSLAGGYLFARIVSDDPPAPDAVLTDPQDRTVPEEISGIPTNDAVEGSLLPDAVVTDASGDEISTASFVGEPLVINFWFSTCIPCERELPDFAEVHAEVGDEVRFIGINTIDPVPTMERFAAERGVTYELYQDTFAELVEAAGVAAFPYTLFVDENGVIVDQTGVLDADGLRERVAELRG